MAYELLPNEIDRLRESLEREQGLRLAAEGAAGRAERELAERRRLSDLLQVIADAANCAATPQAAVQMVLDEICAHTGWPVGHAYLASADAPPVLVSAGLWHFDPPERFGRLRQSLAVSRVPAPESLPGRVLATGECAWVRDLAQDDSSARGELACAAGLQGAFALPVTIGASTAAVLEFFSELPVKPEAAFLEVAAQVGAHLGRAFERLRAAEHRAKLEAQLLRARRLEAIGALAGGIAHDLNNLLAPMMTGVGLLQGKLAEPEDREMGLVIEAAAQRGAQLVKQLLAAAAADEAAPPAPAEPAADGGGELILVVDDEAAVREVTRRTLEKHRYRVVTAGEGREALTVFMQRWNDVKLVLTDTLMPVMGGVALVRALRALNPELKVVATSGLDEDRRRAELAALGVSDFIRKPFRPQELLAAIERQLAGPVGVSPGA
jgi:CheY-like chemotaxis protein